MSDSYCEEALSGRTQVKVVRDTPHVLAFHHTRPSYPVHIVVVPKQHILSLVELPHDSVIAAEIVRVLGDVADEVAREHGAASVVTNLGAYQESKHLHFHVIVREAS